MAGSLGVIETVQSARDRKGSLYILPPESPPEQKCGYAPPTGDPLATWLGDWTNDPSRSDNVRKLRSTDAAERHLFILVAGFTAAPFAVVNLLISPQAPIPTGQPVLPPEVTHVWGYEHLGFGRWLPLVADHRLDTLHETRSSEP